MLPAEPRINPTHQNQVTEHFGGLMLSLREIAQAAGLKKGKPQLDKLDPGLVLKWGAEQAAYAVCLHRYLRPRLVKNGVVTPYETMERPLVQVSPEQSMHRFVGAPRLLQGMERPPCAVDRT